MFYSSPIVVPAASKVHSYATPAALVMVIALVVFVVELTEPLLFGLMPPLPERTMILVDGMLMISVLSPLLYLFLMRPMMAQIRWREGAEDQLRSINQRLEGLVEERTNELLGANRKLSTAIDEQRSVAESLRRTSGFVESVFNTTACLLLAFDATTRRPVYANSRLTDLLGYEQDEIATSSDDVALLLISPRDRERFVEHISVLINEPTADQATGTYDFITANGGRCSMVVGLTVLDEAPSRQAKHLLLTAMPTQT